MIYNSRSRAEYSRPQKNIKTRHRRDSTEIIEEKKKSHCRKNITPEEEKKQGNKFTEARRIPIFGHYNAIGRDNQASYYRAQDGRRWIETRELGFEQACFLEVSFTHCFISPPSAWKFGGGFGCLEERAGTMGDNPGLETILSPANWFPCNWGCWYINTVDGTAFG